MQMLTIVSTLGQGKKVNISIIFFINLKLNYGKAVKCLVNKTKQNQKTLP